MDAVNLEVKVSGLNEATEKASQLIKKMQEAKSLAGELASCIGELKLSI